MKMLAGAGALLTAPVWKGVTVVEVGTDRICTRTGRWRSRDSVKNLACPNVRLLMTIDIYMPEQ